MLQTFYLIVSQEAFLNPMKSVAAFRYYVNLSGFSESHFLQQSLLNKLVWIFALISLSKQKLTLEIESIFYENPIFIN